MIPTRTYTHTYTNTLIDIHTHTHTPTLKILYMYACVLQCVREHTRLTIECTTDPIRFPFS